MSITRSPQGRIPMREWGSQRRTGERRCRRHLFLYPSTDLADASTASVEGPEGTNNLLRDALAEHPAHSVNNPGHTRLRSARTTVQPIQCAPCAMPRRALPKFPGRGRSAAGPTTAGKRFGSSTLCQARSTTQHMFRDVRGKYRQPTMTPCQAR